MAFWADPASIPPLKGVPERQRGRGMSATMPGCFEAETSQATGTSPCARRHVRLPVAVPLRRGNCVILVAFFISTAPLHHTMSGWMDGMNGFILDVKNAPQQPQVLHDAKS